MKLHVRRILSLFLVFTLLFTFIPQTVLGKAYDPNKEYKDLGVRFWEDQKPDVGFYINAAARYTLETVEEPGFGTISGEWSVMNLLRGLYTKYDYINYIPDDYFEKYISRVEDYVSSRKGNLNRHKSTEWSRSILSLTALGYDITDVAGYDYIEKLSSSHAFSYRQGINGPIWEIIAMNTGGYQFYPDPENKDVNTFGKMIDYILDQEIEQSDGTIGGWALANFLGTGPDPDITGMALQALAPYYLDEELYNSTGATKSYDELVGAVERALYVLSEMQDDNGAFKAFGQVNTESTAQVIVALTALGIDPLDDDVELNVFGKKVNVSFVTDGATQDGVETKNMIDALLTFWAENSGSGPEVGGFKHVTTGNDGGGGAGYNVNAMATDQGLYALIAYDRFKKGLPSLYDMSDMKNGEYVDLKDKNNLPSRSIEFVMNDENKVENAYTYSVIDIPEGEDVKGKKFKHWNSKKDGKGTVYKPGERLVVPEEDITLYAQYDNLNYKINFEFNGATYKGEGLPSSYTIEDEINLPTSDQLALDNYEFNGWYDNPEFKGEPISIIPKGSSGDKTFYAKWVSTNNIEEELVEDVNKLIHDLPNSESITLSHQGDVELARLAYERLDEELQNLVVNVDKLKQAEEAIEGLLEKKNEEAVNKVEQAIKSLPEVEDFELSEHEDLLEDVRKDFYSLTRAQEELLDKELIEIFVELENRYFEAKEMNEDEAVANRIEKRIANLPNNSTFSDDEILMIEYVESLYSELTDIQRQHISNTDYLERVSENLEAFKAQVKEQEEEVSNVIKLINDLPSIEELSLNDKKFVVEAREAYDKLDVKQQYQVSNIKQLLLAEEQMNLLEAHQEDDDKERANQVIDLINSLPSVDEIKLDDEQAVLDARKSYEELTKEEKEFVHNINQLIDLENELKELKNIASEKSNLEKTIKKAEQLNTSGKTATSIDNLNKALQEANQVLNDDNVSLEEVKSALKALEKAMNSLEDEKIIHEDEEINNEDDKTNNNVDKSQLENLINEAEKLDTTGKTKESVSQLDQAIKQAKETLGKRDATSEDVDEAMNSLQKAMNNLVESKSIQDKEEASSNMDPSKQKRDKNHDSEDMNQLKEEVNEKAGEANKHLPSTASQLFNVLILGISLFLIGVFIRYYKRRTV